MANAIFIEDMHVGLTRERTRLITMADIEAFGAVSGDRNPVHFDADYAAGTMFGGVIAHGMLSASLLSGILGEELPGAGAVYLGQTIKFRAPVRPGDVVVSSVSVAEIVAEKRRVTLDCACRVGDAVVLDGQAIMLARSRAEMVDAAEAAA